MSSEDDIPTRSVRLAAGFQEADPEFEAFLQAYLPALNAGVDDGTLDVDGDGELVGRLPPEDDVALAALVAERLFTEELALRLFPAEAREQLGSPDRWRWCLLYVRCCWMFSWLVCRGCRNFRSLAYYLYHYVRCVREAAGVPLDTRGLADAERADLSRLFAAFGEVYTEYLEGERLSVKLDTAQTDRLIAGRHDCCRDDRLSLLIFERLLTAENAPVVLGREGYAQRLKNPFFWLCRCWCLAAIRFGCCLACARTRAQLLACWRRYREELEDCWGPLHCAITHPTGCVSDELEPAVNGFGVPVIGTAAGAWFGGYTIEWRKSEGELVNVDGAAAEAACANGDGWTSANVVYPGGGTSGSAPVVNGVLGWLDTTNATARAYDIRVCVRSLQGAAPPCCCIQFNLFRHLVWISHVAGLPVQVPFGRFNAASQIVNANPGGHLMSVGCCFSVRGSAWVGECNDRQIQCFDLRYAPGCLPGPDQPGFDPTAYVGSCLPTPVCYGPPDENEKRAPWNQVFAQALTTQFVQMTEYLFPPPAPPRKWWELQDLCWDSRTLPACVDLTHTCSSGQYTLLVDVEDTQGNHYYDTQCIWIDNKPIHAVLNGFQGVKSCTEMSLRELGHGQPCAQPWLVPLLGIAFDEYIVESDHTIPSDNFDSYDIWIARGCGGPWYRVPITPDFVQWHQDPFTGQVTEWQGRTRVGEPGTRCERTLNCPTPPTPTTPLAAVLTAVDLRIFDAQCAGSIDPKFRPPPGFALQRGECCGYAIQLTVRDRTRSDYTGNCHTATALCAVCICNDLPRTDVLGGTEVTEVSDATERLSRGG
ncbi:MAG TPA: hypothetical protein VFS20_06250 [Longimicrobium sp.]|nr:hypothetical protein [Longimicrobium sp.]